MQHSVDSEDFIRLIESEFDDLPIGHLRPEGIYKNVLQWNSINSVVLSVVIEAEYGVMLESEDFRQTETVQELIDLVSSKLIRSDDADA